MNQSEKAYFLKNLELAVLLSLKGMKSLYGFKMDNIERPEPALVYQTLFDLGKKDLIDVVGQKHIYIYPELDQILEDIKSAEKMLLYVSRSSEYPEQCIYLGSRAVFVSPYGTMGDMNRIQGVPKEVCPDKICESGFCMKEIVSDESILGKEQVEEPKLEEKADILFTKDFASLEDNEWGDIVISLKMLCLKSKKYKKQYLIVKGRLIDYFAVTDEKTCIYPYSPKRVLNTLKTDIERMKH